MIDLHERKLLGSFFYRWLRLADDINMSDAAERIKTDTDRLFIVQHRLDRELDHSDKIIELLNATLNYTETKALLSRIFYSWLTRANQKSRRMIGRAAYASPASFDDSQSLAGPSSAWNSAATVNKGKAHSLDQFGVSPHATAEQTAERDRIRLFAAPAWPGPHDVICKSVAAYEGKLPPLAPLHDLADILMANEGFDTAKRTAKRETVPQETTEPVKRAKEPEKKPSSSEETSEGETAKPEFKKSVPSNKSKSSSSSSSSAIEEPVRPRRSTSSSSKSESSSMAETVGPPNETPLVHEEKQVSPPINTLPRMKKIEIAEDSPTAEEADTPLSSSASSSSSNSSSGSSSDSTGSDPFFKLSLLFFVRMRRVCRAWAQRARDTVARKRLEASINGAVEHAMAAWQPVGVPGDLSSRMTTVEALKIFKAGAMVMKRKGNVQDIDVKDGWLTKTFSDQKRFIVGQPDVLDKFILYYDTREAFSRGEGASGSYSFEEIKLARFSFKSLEMGISSPPGQMKKISQIPENFFIALVCAIKYAIGVQVRRNSGVANVFATRRM
jgi:hypothetical protein